MSSSQLVYKSTHLQAQIWTLKWNTYAAEELLLLALEDGIFFLQLVWPLSIKYMLFVLCIKSIQEVARAMKPIFLTLACLSSSLN